MRGSEIIDKSHRQSPLAFDEEKSTFAFAFENPSGRWVRKGELTGQQTFYANDQSAGAQGAQKDRREE